MGKGGSVSVQGGKVMSEGALVNTGAVCWPDPVLASVAVRSMQSKLHRWAGEDPSRRFGDLFNLVYDPAFLVGAWERVSANKGAKTAGIDKVTAAWVETVIGVGAFLGQIRAPWWLDALHDQVSDIRYAIRALAKNPVFSLTVIGVLTLGIGLNAAVFTMLKSMALTPLAGVDGSARLA